MQARLDSQRSPKKLLAELESDGADPAVSVLCEPSGDTRLARGTKLGDFPIAVRARDDGAEFTIRGGRGLLPVVVGELTNYRWPRIERRAEGGWVEVRHSRVGARDGALVRERKR